MAEEIDQSFPTDKRNVEAPVRAGVTNSSSARVTVCHFVWNLLLNFWEAAYILETLFN